MTATLNRFCNCNHSNRIARLINTCDLCAISSINERHFYHRQQLVSFSIGRQKFIGRRRHLHPYNSRFWRATEEQDEQCPSLSLTQVWYTLRAIHADDGNQQTRFQSLIISKWLGLYSYGGRMSLKLLRLNRTRCSASAAVNNMIRVKVIAYWCNRD